MRRDQITPLREPLDARPGDNPTGLTALQEFATTLAHELKTPLAIISNATAMALDRDADGPVEDLDGLLAMISRNTDLALQLLDRLQLARDVEAGEVELQLGDIELATLVRESVDDLRQVVMSGHPVQLEATASPIVRADATAAREIIFNLLANAAKYSERGAAVDVALDVTDGLARVVVRNHGRGVTPGHTEAIFERFFQSDSGSKGTGLGLFISRGLARAHGGDLTVRPASEEGSEFELTLPLSGPDPA